MIIRISQDLCDIKYSLQQDITEVISGEVFVLRCIQFGRYKIIVSTYVLFTFRVSLNVDKKEV